MLWDDVRYACRLMRRSPGFTAVAVLSLALGIGANTAIFSLFNTVMLHQLPVAQPEQLVQLVLMRSGDRNDGYRGWQYYESQRDHNRSFSAVTGMSFDNLAVVRVDGFDAETVVVENAVGNYFQVLGLKPAIGRVFTPGDVLASGSSNVAVLSWAYWDSRFHRDPAVLGKRVFYDDQTLTVIGVGPGGYDGPRVGEHTDLWIAHERDQLTILARLKPGVTRAQAASEATALERAARTDPVAARQVRIELEPAGAGLTRIRDRYGKSLVLLMGVVGLLLLLACINMASLLLARSAGRQRELGVRVGLGASRGRLVRQMLTESVLLSGIGTLAGVGFAYAGQALLVRIIASGRAFERLQIHVALDLRLLLFTAGIAMLTGLLFGLAPAWHAFHAAPAAAMRRTGSGGDPWLWRLFGRALVAAQVALSILLVTSATVFLAHLDRMRHFDLGFRSDHVLLLVLEPGRSPYKPEQLFSPYQELLLRLQQIPGVRSATISGCSPIQGCGSGGRFLTAEGFTERPEDRQRSAVSWVAPRYFETLGIPMLTGRDFDFRDVGRPRVAIVSESLTRRYFPNGNPIGRHVTVDPDGGAPFEIVGVVGDAKGAQLREAAPRTIYFNMFQERHPNHQFELRTSVDPASVAAPAQRAIREVLSAMPVRRVMSLEDQIDGAIVPERLIALLSEFFGALGAALAGIGLYGLLAYTVTRRTNEIGVRMALGATPSDVGCLVLRDALAMVCAGLASGACLVHWGRPLAASLVDDLRPVTWAPVMIGGAVAVAVAMLAAYLPVRRASRVDPLEALRME
jgi:predicted permease